MNIVHKGGRMRRNRDKEYGKYGNNIQYTPVLIITLLILAFVFVSI